MKFVAIEGEAIYFRTFALTAMPWYTQAFKILHFLRANVSFFLSILLASLKLEH